MTSQTYNIYTDNDEPVALRVSSKVRNKIMLAALLGGEGLYWEVDRDAANATPSRNERSTLQEA